MAQNSKIPAVDLAQGGTVTNSVLDELIALTDDLERGDLSHEGGTLILLNLPACLRELRDRREIADLIHSVTNPDNVIHLASRN